MNYKESIEIIKKFTACETHRKNNTCDGDCLWAQDGCQYDVEQEDVVDACQNVIEEWEKREEMAIVSGIIVFFAGVILGIFIGSTM